MRLHHFLTNRCHTTCCVLTNRVVLPAAVFATRRNGISNCISCRDVRGQAHRQHAHHQRHPGASYWPDESWREARCAGQCQSLGRRGTAQGAGGARRSVPERVASDSAQHKGVQRQHAVVSDSVRRRRRSTARSAAGGERGRRAEQPAASDGA
eukprot:6212925-Pleurochrysis_carterae.AAC.2